MAIQSPNVVPAFGVFAFGVARKTVSMAAAASQVDRLKHFIWRIERLIPKSTDKAETYARGKVVFDCVIRIQPSVRANLEGAS